MDLAELRRKIAGALEALEAELAGLVNSLAHSNAEVTLQDDPSPSAIRRACEAYSAINYDMEDEVGTSVVCLGVLGVTADILKRAARVNSRKAELKALCAPLNKVKIRMPVKGEAGPTELVAAMRVILRNIRRSDLNLLAAYRKIPILDTPPATITYTRATTRSVYRKSVEELYELLSTAEGHRAAEDRARLAALPRRETHLAFVKERYPNVRANVLLARLDPRGRGRLQMAAELPVLYPRGRQDSPEIRFPALAAAERTRKSALESVRYLETLPVYRYTARALPKNRLL